MASLQNTKSDDLVLISSADCSGKLLELDSASECVPKGLIDLNNGLCGNVSDGRKWAAVYNTSAAASAGYKKVLSASEYYT